MPFHPPYHRACYQLQEPRVLHPQPWRLLVLLAAGYNLNEAAARLHIAVSTANVQIATAKTVLGTRTTTGAVVKAIQMGLIDLAALPRAPWHVPETAA